MNTLQNHAAEPDSALMHLVAHGVEEAFAALYDRFSSGLYSVAYLILLDHGESEAVVQEVFITIWQNAPFFLKDGGRVLDWAITITNDRAVDRVRAKQKAWGKSSSQERNFTPLHTAERQCR